MIVTLSELKHAHTTGYSIEDKELKKRFHVDEFKQTQYGVFMKISSHELDAPVGKPLREIRAIFTTEHLKKTCEFFNLRESSMTGLTLPEHLVSPYEPSKY